MSVLVIEQGSRSLELEVFGYSVTNEYGVQTHAEVEVLRSRWRTIVDSISKVSDEFIIEVSGSTDFAGRLVQFSNQDEKVLLEIGSFEEDAINAQPYEPNEEVFVGNDSELVETAIGDVDSLQVGTVETVGGTTTFNYANASPAKVIRELQRESGAYVRYNADKTVDYLGDIGGTFDDTVIASSKRNVLDSFEIIEDEREEYTHVRVLGAQQGKAQLTFDTVIDGYESGEPQSWFKYKDKEITSQERAENVAQTLVEEFESDDRSLSVKVGVFGLDVSLGDEYVIRSNTDDFEKLLTAVKVERIEVGSSFDYMCVFSNRVSARINEGRNQRRSVDKQTEVYEGDLLQHNTEKLDASTPVEYTDYFRDDVERFVDAYIRIEAESEIDLTVAVNNVIYNRTGTSTTDVTDNLETGVNEFSIEGVDDSTVLDIFFKCVVVRRL